MRDMDICAMPALSIEPDSPLYAAYLDLRFRVLRAPLGLARGTEHDPVDGLPSTRHWVWLEEDKITACMQLQAREWPGLAQVRLVAVEPDMQGKGYGRKLMDVLERAAAEEGYTIITLNARENAVPFYLALGYDRHEETEDYHGIRHWRMTKELGTKAIG